MSGAVQLDVRDVDWVLALAATVVGVSAFVLLAKDPPAAPAREAPRIATLATTVADVRRRPSGTLVWEDLAAGADLAEGDALFVPPQSAATVVFEDGTRLDLDENTLVALEARATANDATTVRVDRGRVVGQSGDSALALKTQDGVALLDKGGAAELVRKKKGAEVDVLKGSARLEDGTRVAERESARSSSGGWERRGAWPLVLTSPSALARVYFQGDAPNPVPLAWVGDAPLGARVEVSAAAEEEDVLVSVAAGPQGASFTPPAAGRYAWRVVDAAGKPLSDTRRILLVRDVPPLPLGPRQGEIIPGYLGQRVPFAWTRVPGVRSYVLEVSDSADFKKVLFTRDVDGTGLRVDWPLGEGRYFWRVRSSAAERGQSPYSRLATFRYLTKPVPDAPELIDSELELDP